jgi:undecaprenyl-diphosphatase
MDAQWYRDVNRFAAHTAWAHGFAKAFAVYGVGIFALLVIGAWWAARSVRVGSSRAVAAAIWTAGATPLAVLLNQPLVSAFHRARPFQRLHGVEVLISRSHDFTFPSDHAVTAGAATAGLWVTAHYAGKMATRVAIAGTVLAVLVAFSRVYVGVHYPGDVAAGLAIGAVLMVLGWRLVGGLLTALVDAVGRQARLAPFVRRPDVDPQLASSE